ncbi:MAG TPA: hypothetical protein VMS21_08665, partial [Methylomirabilota bacterium]|nr:hypothetical protein [Methylomirabilota bacterium]
PFPAPFGLTTQLPIPVEHSFGATPPPASNTTPGTLATHAETGAAVAVRPGGITLHGVISLVWLTGFLGLMMIAITRHSRWSQAIRQARPITDPNLLSLLAEARHTMRKRRIVMIKHPRKPGMTARIGTILLVLSLCAVTFTRAAEREPDTGPLSNRDSPARRTPAGVGVLLAQNKTTTPEETFTHRAVQAGEAAPLPFFQVRLVLDEPAADSEELIQVISEPVDGRAGQQSPQPVRESVRAVHTHRQPLLDHTAFHSARGLVDQGLPEASLEIVLTAEGAGKFAEATREHLGEKVAFILDGKVHSVGRIAGEIHGGVIRFNEPTLEKATALADKLNAAASKIDAKR